MPFFNYVQFYVKLHISALQGGRGGGEVFVAKLFISTRLGDALKIEMLLHDYIDHFLKKIFIPCRVGSKLFISKLIQPPPPLWRLNGGPLNTKCHVKPLVSVSCFFFK